MTLVASTLGAMLVAQFTLGASLAQQQVDVAPGIVPLPGHTATTCGEQAECTAGTTSPRSGAINICGTVDELELPVI
ncbi:MAG: hypothetical protein JOY51_08915, partial [Nevskia sp.]|nr:hypothetical protein [Nevskia sp.]